MIFVFIAALTTQCANDSSPKINTTTKNQIESVKSAQKTFDDKQRNIFASDQKQSQFALGTGNRDSSEDIQNENIEDARENLSDEYDEDRRERYETDPSEEPVTSGEYWEGNHEWWESREEVLPEGEVGEWPKSILPYWPDEDEPGEDGEEVVEDGEEQSEINEIDENRSEENNREEQPETNETPIEVDNLQQQQLQNQSVPNL